MEDVGLKEETRDAVDTVFITDEIAKEELRLIEEREEQTKTADTVRNNRRAGCSAVFSCGGANGMVLTPKC